MRRREFIAGLTGAAAWPLLAGAQRQPEKMQRIGVLMPSDESDSEYKIRLSAFIQALGAWAGPTVATCG
jgi:hypothetical protein